MIRALAPRSLEEAIYCLTENPDLIPAAGCTDLMVTQHVMGLDATGVMDLLRIPRLRGIRRYPGGWEIGATTTFSDISRSRRLHAALPALTVAASHIGAWQIQNRATLGGNIANASPAGDSLPVLLSLGARIVAAGSEGLREIPYESFHTGYRKTALSKGEIIAWVHIPDPLPESIQFFRKVGTRQAQSISKIALALCAAYRNGRIESVRIGAGSIAPVPIRLYKTEQLLTGRPGDPAAADEAAAAAMNEVTPIDDVRSTAEYRRYVLGRLVRRMVLRLGGYL
ncbi:MAG: xanthine dehydrogenase family protein subunit M [Candidatus Eisenbacteria bacterium]|uniref:Xanthine dehydrogenase family protein subunit M n=1 Tax=Eiseniibacteriota bacterium TaxID=2212470 RepID=A0A948RYQ4_UNCEI|nr:xanthine dehydrogenase family protein subunit M [Candidatus Eisenbacteria bacterium]MBU1947699.1 xanthine dehydrogenase family protein subunit M [Candidatus Eisenbacteria bacterium]MBU2692057.1 xanthine dehydrogenase family protein subunit M [Candidatus Eisenbacteria bacterium]